MTKVYNSIGKSYDSTRKADPKILAGLISHLACEPHDKKILEVGCGSGNYTVALHHHGFQMTGLDISEEMLGKARQKAQQVKWLLGNAEELPFADKEFDGVVSVLATHHMQDLDAVFRHMIRVVKPGKRLVLFTSSPEQMRNFWLTHYLPEVVEITAKQMLNFQVLKGKLEGQGFTKIERSNFVVDDSLQDFFLHCGKYRPELYLDPVVRAGISSFALCEDHEALKRGMKKLEDDIRSGEVQNTIKKHDDSQGDFMFVTATKPVA